MKKVVFILIVLSAFAFSSCVSYVLPTRYTESTPYSKDYVILGSISIDLPVKQDYDDVKGVKEMAIEKALEQYPDADDIVDVTIMSKSKIMYSVFFGAIPSYKTTLEGNVIKYKD